MKQHPSGHAAEPTNAPVTKSEQAAFAMQDSKRPKPKVLQPSVKAEWPKDKTNGRNQ